MGDAADDTLRATPIPTDPRWRRIGRRLLFATVVIAQAFFIVRAYGDPNTHFGYQPFNESSTFRADIFRVSADGRRVPISEPWPGGYRWEELVDKRGLDTPGHLRHADSGVDSVMYFLERALAYVASHTPNDDETLYLEAEVTYFRNTYGPMHRLFRSQRRELGER